MNWKRVNVVSTTFENWIIYPDRRRGGKDEDFRGSSSQCYSIVSVCRGREDQQQDYYF